MIEQQRTRVKICGITNTGDAIVAVNAGVDALGLVFYPPSPRNVSLEQAQFIVSKLPAFVTTTALFVNPEVEFVKQVIVAVKIDLLQFHGDETPEFCQQFNRPYIKAIRMQKETDLVALSKAYIASQGLLLDTYKKSVAGGTGETFNWDWLAKFTGQLATPIILAGGLTPENIVRAVATVKPWAVDVSSGVEISPGKKDTQKVLSLIKRALMENNYDC